MLEETEIKIGCDLRDIVIHNYPFELRERNNFLSLCEVRSIPTITDALATKITEYCQYLVDKEMLPKPIMKIDLCDEYKIVVPNNIVDDVYGNFIENLYCEVQLVLLHDNSSFYETLKGNNSGAYDDTVHSDELSGVGLNKKLKNAKIQVRCFALKSNVYYSVFSSLIHEFNHCYEDYMRLMSGGETLSKWIDKTHYRDNTLTMSSTKSENVSKLCFIIYNLSKTEINAKVVQIYGELKGRFFQNNSFACSSIKETSAYKTILQCYGFLEDLNSVNDVVEQNKIIETFNSCSYKRTNSYKQLIDNLKKDLNNTKEIIFRKAAKHISRLNQEYLAKHNI